MLKRSRSRGGAMRVRQTLVLHLAPGHYVLYCNLEGHYLGGMYAALTVH